MRSDREHRTESTGQRNTKGRDAERQMPDFKWKTIKPDMLLRDVSIKKY